MQAQRLAPITMAKARWILGSFVYPRLGSRPIAEITAREVLAVLRPICVFHAIVNRVSTGW
jgi:hypothetical protein